VYWTTGVLFALFFIFYVYVRSDGHSAKKWQSTDAGIQSHVLKSVAAFVCCLSNELLRLPPIKVCYALLSCSKLFLSVPSYSRVLCINTKIQFVIKSIC
jgi:hypothetical protein